MAGTSFKEIREGSFEHWLTQLNRKREGAALSDDYSESYVCKWQNQLLDQGKHCSFLCSIGDWSDNLSDLLDDERYDALGPDDKRVLFRYYTRILLVISEMVEDFVNLHKLIKGQSKAQTGRDLEQHGFANEELKNLSNLINSVCKHKIEHDNLHVHNHHMTIEFEDFGATAKENQIRLDQLTWGAINDQTTILMPRLKYFIEVVVKLNHIFDGLLTNEPGYKERFEEVFSKDWSNPGNA